ncbi:MAG: hypothetical protein LBQ36_01825 [Synergistaceae bacterium]|jgi:Tfp pilus assembly protein FimT|nr:hypothetical protein [Synergistaceae bacterium]
MGKITRRGSFTLAEMAVAVPIMLILMSMAFTSAFPSMKRYSDPESDFLIASEVENAAEWLQSLIHRGLSTRSDFTLTAPNTGTNSWLSVRWAITGKMEKWSSKIITLKNKNINSSKVTYSQRFQTLTPALTVLVYSHDGKYLTDWRISISAYGFVDAFRDA